MTIEEKAAILSGKIHQANEGCSCAMGTVMTQFIQNLRLKEDQFALMDMEAGIEHFGQMCIRDSRSNEDKKCHG